MAFGPTNPLFPASLGGSGPDHPVPQNVPGPLFPTPAQISAANAKAQAAMRAKLAPPINPAIVQKMFGNNPQAQADMRANNTTSDTWTPTPGAGSGNPIPGGAIGDPSNNPTSDPWTPYSGPSGDAMAKAQYAAQYALLDKMSKDSAKSYANAGNQMGGIYDALSKAMSGQTAGIQKQYADSGKSIGANYNSAISETNAGYDKSRGALEQMAANLGIQAGLPAAESAGYNQQNFLGGLMKANQANDTSYNTHMGQNEVSYNTRNAQIEKNMGASSRQDFKDRGLVAQQGIADKRLSVTSNRAQSANDYAMKIAQMNSNSKSAWNTDQTNKARDIVAAQHEKNTSDAAAAKQAASDRAAASDTSKLNAYQLLQSGADTAYNHNSRDAQKAIKIIQDLWDGGWGGDKNWTSSADFYNDVARSNPSAASSQLSQLANMFYTKMAGGAGKPISGGTGRISWTDANGT